MESLAEGEAKFAEIPGSDTFSGWGTSFVDSLSQLTFEFCIWERLLTLASEGPKTWTFLTCNSCDCPAPCEGRQEPVRRTAAPVAMLMQYNDISKKKELIC